MNPLQKRLREFVGSLGCSVQEFERQCDIKAGTASRMTEKSYFTTFHKIQTAYPELNMNWLKTGEGEMLKPTESMIQQKAGGDQMQSVYGDVLKIGNPDLAKKLVEELRKDEDEICSLKFEIAHLKELLKEKDARIADLEKSVSRLEKMNDHLMNLK